MKVNIKKVVNVIASCMCIVGLLFSVAYIGITYNEGQNAQKELSREIRLNYTINRHEFNEIYTLLYDMIKMQSNTTNIQKDVVDRQSDIIDKQLNSTTRQIKIIDLIDGLSKKQNIIDKTLTKKINSYSDLKINDIERIKKANILITNYSVGALGAGTIIKIKGKYYILTCAHLVKNNSDIISGVFDDGQTVPLKLIDYNRKSDLALFSFRKSRVSAYLELSTVIPKDGSELVIIGNPNGVEDVITRGNLCKKHRRFYMFSNLIFFGNSGGCVIYNNKVVGVASALQTMRANGVDVHYGWCSGIVNINRFLEDCGAV